MLIKINNSALHRTSLAFFKSHCFPSFHVRSCIRVCVSALVTAHHRTFSKHVPPDASRVFRLVYTKRWPMLVSSVLHVRTRSKLKRGKSQLGFDTCAHGERFCKKTSLWQYSWNAVPSAQVSCIVRNHYRSPDLLFNAHTSKAAGVALLSH